MKIDVFGLTLVLKYVVNFQEKYNVNIICKNCMNKNISHLLCHGRQVCSTYVLLLSLLTHQGRDGPKGTIWSTRTQRTYRKTWKTRQTSRPMLFPPQFPAFPSVCMMVGYDCGLFCAGALLLVPPVGP